MAYSCTVDPDERLGVITLSGSVTDDEVVEAMSSLLGNSSWVPGYDILWDCERITELLIDRQGLDEVVVTADMSQDRMGDGKSAFVLRRKLDETMTRVILHMVKSRGRERRLFREREEALQWLHGGKA